VKQEAQCAIKLQVPKAQRARSATRYEITSAKSATRKKRNALYNYKSQKRNAPLAGWGRDVERAIKNHNSIVHVHVHETSPCQIGPIHSLHQQKNLHAGGRFYFLFYLLKQKLVSVTSITCLT
jgi:hypothetical protein